MADYFTNFSLVLKLANETEQDYALDLAHKPISRVKTQG